MCLKFEFQTNNVGPPGPDPVAAQQCDRLLLVVVGEELLVRLRLITQAARAKGAGQQKQEQHHAHHGFLPISL